MKSIISIASTMVCAFVTFAQPNETHTAKLTVRVVDESGKTLTNVPVAASVVDHFRSSGFNEPVYKDIAIYTDNHGLAVISAPNSERRLGYGVANYAGYYDNTTSFTFQSAITGNWQPWNARVDLVLIPIGVQVAGYAQRINDMRIATQGKPLGYDLMIGDWVGPYGKGETSDFIFEWDIRITNFLTLKFSNEGDGIQLVAAKEDGLTWPRVAPSDGYESLLIKWEWIERGTNNGVPFGKEHSNYRGDFTKYFFRVRTLKDSEGKIVSALYGRNMGDFIENLIQGKIDLDYWLSSETNSRNMEVDTKRNLIGTSPPRNQ